MTTTVRADIQIEAPRSAVWRILADLETPQDYDTEVVRSFYVSEAREGVGASRQCDLPDGTHVTETVVSWRDEDGYVIEAYEDGTDLPTTDMEVEFTLVEAAGGTRPSASPESWSGRICGWVSLAVVSISARNRSAPTTAASSALRTFRATLRLWRSSWAR